MPQLSFDNKCKNFTSICESKSPSIRASITEYCKENNITVSAFAKLTYVNIVRLQSFMKGLINIDAFEFGELMRILIICNRNRGLMLDLYHAGSTGIL